MHRPTLPWLLSALAVASTAALAAGQAHEHGAVKLDVAIEGSRLIIAMEAPLDNLLGFERAPRTDVERKAAAALLARLRSPDQGGRLFGTDAAALCRLDKAEVQAPVLEPAGGSAVHGDHADLDASYSFTCTQAAGLRALDVGLFDAYPRIQRIDVQVAGPKGQSKVTLRRPARAVKLAR
jgi:hypothetical protein